MSLCRKALHSPVLTTCVCVFLEGVSMPEYRQRTKVQGKSHPISMVKFFQNPKINRSHLVFVVLFCNKSSIYFILSLFQPSRLLIPILDQAPMHHVFSICNLVHVTLTSFFYYLLPVACNSVFWIYTCMFSTTLPHSCTLQRHQKIHLYNQLHLSHFNLLYLEYSRHPAQPSSYDTILVICNLIRMHNSSLTAPENCCTSVELSAEALRS